MPDNKKFKFKLPIPGLSTCPPIGVSVNDEILVDAAICNLIVLLSDPYNHEAIRFLIRDKHPSILSFKKGRQYKERGKLARSIIDSYSKKEKRRLGRPNIPKSGLDNILAYIESEQQKPGKKRNLNWYSDLIVKVRCPSMSAYRKKKFAKELFADLSNAKRRQKYQSIRKQN